ncbi:MAG TPA: hypothetical protein VIJ11_02330 [Galbitalea sp.]
MPVVTQTVQLYDGYTMFSATSAVIDVDDDKNTFQLSKIDSGGNRTESVFNVPINQVVVRGRATRLRLLVGGVRKMVDFSIGSTLVSGFGGMAGEIAGGVMDSKSGVNQVVAALRKGGAEVHYWSYWKRVGITWLIAIGFIIVIIAVVGLAALAQR